MSFRLRDLERKAERRLLTELGACVAFVGIVVLVVIWLAVAG